MIPTTTVARLQAQINAAKARRAGYRAEAAETVARGGPVRPTDEELGIIKTDDDERSLRGHVARAARRVALEAGHGVTAIRLPAPAVWSVEPSAGRVHGRCHGSWLLGRLL